MWHIVAYSKESEGHVTPATLFVIVFILVNGFYNYSKFLLEIRLLQSCGKSCLFNFFISAVNIFQAQFNTTLCANNLYNYKLHLFYILKWIVSMLDIHNKSNQYVSKNGPIMESFLSTNVLIQKHEYKLIGPHQCHEL